MEISRQIYTFLESLDHEETENQCLHLHKYCICQFSILKDGNKTWFLIQVYEKN